MNYSYLVFLLFVSQATLAQFRYQPATPQVGQAVSFTYSPQGTPLTTDSTLEARYVRYSSPATMNLSRPASVTLVRQGTEYVGKLRLPGRDVAGMVLLFRNSQQPRRIDANRGKMYVVPVCDANGCPVPHALGGQAAGFTRTGFLYDTPVKPDPNWLVLLYEGELAQNSGLRPDYWSDYCAALIKQKKPGYGPRVKKEINAYLASRPAPTAAELNAAALLYESLGDFAGANAQRERLKTLDPAGSLAQRDRAAAVRNEANWVRKKALYQAFMREFPNASQAPGLTVLMTDGYFKNGDIQGLLTFVEGQPTSHTEPLMLNTMAFQLAEERRSLPEAEQLVRRAMTLLDAQPKPSNVSAAAWQGEKQSRKPQLLNTLARTLEQQGNYADAYAVYAQFMSPDDVANSDPRLNERYFLCALRANHAADARPLAEAAVEVGKATTGLKTALRNWYAKQPGQDAAKADAYVANLEADLRAGQRDELRTKLINEPAPAFSMTDLQGRTIASSALKGKVVVLDFWATWCAPCVASFPAMQQAQTRFQNDPNVRFLFVNTREGGPLQRVHTFMDKHPYPFVVPIDGSQRVANAYKVQGIPTKVVIGPNGRVRYRAVGYNGNPETTVDELTLVVELLKEEK